jgi:F-type H+-transporting ATPase subunit b
MKLGNYSKNVSYFIIAVSTPFLNPNYAFGAGSNGMFSLDNTDFVVLISFVIFIGILIYFGVPSIITKFLDKRTENIRLEIDNANEVLEEAKALLSSLEEQHKNNALSVKKMIENAKGKAAFQEDKSKKYIEDLVKNRIISAKEQISSAERKILTEIKESAIDLGFTEARAQLEKNLKEDSYVRYLDKSIKTVEKTLAKIRQ